MQTKEFRIVLLVLLVLLVQGTWALAATTGDIEGKVTDQNGNGIVGAKVTAASPAQSSSATTLANGFYTILSLNPDTYTVTASKDGYDTSSVYGVTVTQNQTTAADIRLGQTVKTIGHVTTTASASIVSKTVTGDLYAVNAKTIANAQGSSGGAETLYSQNSIVGSLPGVTRFGVGSGAGYGGQGQLSLRGGAPDQVGYELEGVALNRGFDFFNATTFNTNGLASLQVYTGGAPADAGKAMSGYVNEVIARGKYPGGADLTAIVGTPLFNHSVQADVYGGTPDSRFTYYVSTLATNSYINFGNRSNLANTSFTVPAGDPGCAAFNAGPSVVAAAGGTGLPLNCSQSYILNSPVGPGAAGTYVATPYAAQRDTATNLNWSLAHNGLNDNLQLLYVVGTGMQPYGLYGTSGSVDNSQASTNYSGDGLCAFGNCPPGYSPLALTWPTGAYYQGQVGAPFNPALTTALTWPTSQGSVSGPIPSTFQDSGAQQYSIEKVGYTRAITQASFLRLFGYRMYSFWSLDQPINGFVGSSFYQLHDDATGVTMDYENQINQHNLIKLIGDWSRDLTLRYNYFNYASSGGAPVRCASGGAPAPCGPGTTVVQIGAPLSNWSTVTPLDWDYVVNDTFKPNDKWQFDIGVRWDEFAFQLMPMQLTGNQGLAYLGEEVNGQCLDGFNYSPSDPRVIGPNGNQNCFDIFSGAAAGVPADLAAFGRVTGSGAFQAKDAPGAAGWSDVSQALAYFYYSPRFGMTFNADPRDVFRISVGRYVQPPNSAFEQYRDNPLFGPGRTVRRLNQFYTGLNFLAVHGILPEDSTNYDFSWEHEFNGGYSLKVTPFYRNTRNQILSIPFDPQSPTFVTGSNFGNARISGFEFLTVKNVTGQEGLGGTLAVTFTNSLIRFDQPPQGGGSFINLMNGTNANGTCQTDANTVAAGTATFSGICGYNFAHGTNYALLDPKGYYHPSYVMSPNATTQSYSVPWVINFQLDWRSHGFDVLPTFNYQSGNPYGEPLNYPDPAGLAVNGPDPYTKTFDSIGSLKGPSWWTINLALAHDVGHNLKASILGTNLISGVHNQGYAWELPASLQNISYADNTFYNTAPLGGGFAATLPNPPQAYYGTNYYAYNPGGTLPMRTYVFSLSAKL